MNILAIKKKTDYTITITFSMYSTDAKKVNRIKDKLFNQLIRSGIDEITANTDETVYSVNDNPTVTDEVDDEEETKDTEDVEGK